MEMKRDDGELKEMEDKKKQKIKLEKINDSWA